jgi:tRNA(adenine34) deaminase
MASATSHLPHPDEHYVREAIEIAKVGFARGEIPFGTVLVNPEGEIVSRYHDWVAAEKNETSHCESMMVREACSKLGPSLAGYSVFSTAEPCPMCFTSMWLAGVSRICFGPTCDEVRAKAGAFLHELWMPARVVNAEYGEGKVALRWGVLKDECLALFDLMLEQKMPSEVA